MATQKEYDFDQDYEENSNSKFSLNKITIITLILFIALSGLFLYFLSIKTSSSFEKQEIIFAIISGIAITLFLVWTRFIMVSNKYLGIAINLMGAIAVVYALTRKYQGTYTTIFLSIGLLLDLFYIIVYLIKLSKK